MKEKIIIKSERMPNIFLIAAPILFLGGWVATAFINYGGDFSYYLEHSIYFWSTTLYCVWGSVLLLLAGLVTFGAEIVVTDKRVYGTALFHRRVDLPIDSISAVGTHWPKCVSVSTSSGKISFYLIRNYAEIHKAINDLLIERQAQKASDVPHTTIKQEIPQSNADELKKYKELLDMGVITQEEFDAKKKQLLGL